MTGPGLGLGLAGTVQLGDGRWITAEVVPGPAATGSSATVVEIDADGIGELFVRFGRPGDRFGALGAPGRKPVRRFMGERGVPREERGNVPLVLHGASSIRQADLAEAVRLGVRKVNVGSSLKRAYFEALRTACDGVGYDYNPYRVLGSGTPDDVLDAARRALQGTVEGFMTLFGSAGRA